MRLLADRKRHVTSAVTQSGEKPRSCLVMSCDMVGMVILPNLQVSRSQLVNTASGEDSDLEAAAAVDPERAFRWYNRLPASGKAVRVVSPGQPMVVEVTSENKPASL